MTSLLRDCLALEISLDDAGPSRGEQGRVRARELGAQLLERNVVARELARKGRRVLLLERGTDHHGRLHYGTHLGALLYADRMSLLFTEEGRNIARPLMVGGATSMYCAFITA